MATNNSQWLATANALQAKAQAAYKHVIATRNCGQAVRAAHRQIYNAANAAYLAHLQTKPSAGICNT